MVAVLLCAYMCDYYCKLRVVLTRGTHALRTTCAFSRSPVRIYITESTWICRGGVPRLCVAAIKKYLLGAVS